MVLAIAVVLAVGTIIFTLFVRTQDLPAAPPISPTAHLEERKAQFYENLRDLRLEFRLGKLSEADYQKTKLDLQRELAKVLAEIDSIQPAQPAQVQVKAAAVNVPERKAKLQEFVCPHCGASFHQAMKFCGECGKAMG